MTKWKQLYKIINNASNSIEVFCNFIFFMVETGRVNNGPERTSLFLYYFSITLRQMGQIFFCESRRKLKWTRRIKYIHCKYTVSLDL